MGGVIPQFGATGNSGNYQMIRSVTTGQVWNGSAMEAWNQAHWANYVISSPEQAGSSCYVALVPALPADRYQAVLYTPVGGSPASGDTPIATQNFDWDGGSVIGVGSPLNIGKVNGSSPAAVNLSLSANAIVSGAAAAGTLSGTQMTTNLVSAVNNQYTGRTLIFASGANQGRAVLITAYAVTGGKLTFIAYGNLPLATPPSAADTFLIL